MQYKVGIYRTKDLCTAARPSLTMPGLWAPFKELACVITAAIGQKRPEMFYVLDSVLKKHKPDFISLLQNPVSLSRAKRALCAFSFTVNLSLSHSLSLNIRSRPGIPRRGRHSKRLPQMASPYPRFPTSTFYRRTLWTRPLFSVTSLTSTKCPPPSCSSQESSSCLGFPGSRGGSSRCYCITTGGETSSVPSAPSFRRGKASPGRSNSARPWRAL